MAFMDNAVIQYERDSFCPSVCGFKVIQLADEQHRTFAATSHVTDLSSAAVYACLTMNKMIICNLK